MKWSSHPPRILSFQTLIPFSNDMKSGVPQVPGFARRGASKIGIFVLSGQGHLRGLVNLLLVLLHHGRVDLNLGRSEGRLSDKLLFVSGYG